jgi:hypothetical protein
VKDIDWHIFENTQNDRLFLVAVGVAFYALLALFPTTAALKEREKRSLVGLTLRLLLFTSGALLVMLLAPKGIVTVPVMPKLPGYQTHRPRRC